MQVALTLGEFKDFLSGLALIQLLGHNASDPWIRTAALTSLNEEGAVRLMLRILEHPQQLVASDLDELALTLVNQLSSRVSPDQAVKMIQSISSIEGLIDSEAVAFQSVPFRLLLTAAERFGATAARLMTSSARNRLRPFGHYRKSPRRPK